MAVNMQPQCPVPPEPTIAAKQNQKKDSSAKSTYRKVSIVNKHKLCDTNIAYVLA